MAPLPWVTLLMLTVFTLLYISTIIFFSMKESVNKNMINQKKNFHIKW
uniref:ATP synthase F0 subunit 8 n=1 Tax=Cacopsylla coccinea TaxID=1646117 RepID=A0A0U1ZY36_CACCO|nr:ATP synthase F0 subunit 8 [Cacopsylla coccinea]AKE49759.1 ATP synthase F0 subunit 8 [Cacopsylla coccinea]